MFYSLYDGKGWYDSMQVKFNKRFSHGFQALVSYTWSKALDYTSGWYGAENGIGGSAAIQDFYHPETSKGPAGYNVPHFLSIAAVYELPFGKGKPMLQSGVGAAILGGWQLNAIAQFRSGRRINLNVTGTSPTSATTSPGGTTPGPNLVGDPHVSNPTEQRWFNTAAFAVPLFSYGNAGKNILSAPGVNNIDLSLFKKFPIKEIVVDQNCASSRSTRSTSSTWAAPDTTRGRARLSG